MRLLNSNQNWHWPEVAKPNPRILEVQVRVLNYIAYLSDYTYDLKQFLDDFILDFELGLAGLSIHSKGAPGYKQYLFRRLPAQNIAFDRTKHSWRIAILGVANDAQIALVPATARKGDIVVALAPHLLPFVLRPVQGDGISAGLFPAHDPYEQALYRKRYFHYRFRYSWTDLLSYLFLFVVLNFALAIPHIFLAESWSKTVRKVEIFYACIHASVLVTVSSITIWYTYRHYRASREVVDHRRRVSSCLDKITERLGEDFEFHGLLFVRQHTINGEWLMAFDKTQI